MRSHYAIYDITSGEILRVVATGSPAMQCADDTQNWVEGNPNDETAYILNGVITDKPEMPCTINGLVISGAPTGAKLLIDNVFAATADGTDITLNFDLAATRTVRLELFPYLDWKETVDAS